MRFTMLLQNQLTSGSSTIGVNAPIDKGFLCHWWNAGGFDLRLELQVSNCSNCGRKSPCQGFTDRSLSCWRAGNGSLEDDNSGVPHQL